MAPAKKPIWTAPNPRPPATTLKLNVNEGSMVWEVEMAIYFIICATADPSSARAAAILLVYPSAHLGQHICTLKTG